MNHAILPSALLLCIATGCHPTPEPSAVSQEPAEESAEPAQPQAETPKRDAVVGNEWQFFYKERHDNPDAVEAYKRALKLVVDKTGISGTLSTISRHIGDWYIIIVETKDDRPRDMIPLDAPAPDLTKAYLVNMAAEEMIQPGDYIAARPLFRGLHLDKHIPDPNPDNEKQYLGSIAIALSAVAFSHTRYIEPITGQVFPEGIGGPSLRVGPNGAVFTYYIASTGMMQSFTVCTLKVSDTSYSFASDIWKPEM